MSGGSAMSIGEAAAATGVPAWRLRAWEAAGLIAPLRAANGFRVFREEDVAEVRRLAARATGGNRLRMFSARAAAARPPAAEREDRLAVAWRSLASAVRGSDDPAELCSAGLDAALLVCEAGIGEVSRADPVSHRLVPIASRGLPAGFAEGTRDWRLHEGLAGRALGLREPVAVRDLTVHPGTARAELWSGGLRGYLAVPLLFGSRRLGLVELYSSEPRSFSSAEIDAVEQLAAMLATAVEARSARARLEESLLRRGSLARQRSQAAQAGERERTAALLEALAGSLARDPERAAAERLAATLRELAAGLRGSSRTLADGRLLLGAQIAAGLGGRAEILFEEWPQTLPIEFASSLALLLGRIAARVAAVSTGGVRVRALGGRVEIAVEFRFRSSGPVPPAGPDPDPDSLPAVRLLRERTAEGELLRVLVAAPEREPLLAKLSERERQVLAELATGGTNADLAAGLGISAKTLQNHLGSIYRKLGVSGRAGAVAALGGEPSGWPP